MGKEGPGFHQAVQVANGEMHISPNEQILAPMGREHVVGLKRKVKEAEAKLTETELEMEEAIVPKIHSRKFTPSPE